MNFSHVNDHTVSFTKILKNLDNLYLNYVLYNLNMYDSNSFIKESIYESQTQNMIKITPPPQQNIIKETKKESVVGTKLNDNNFLKIYE